MIVLTNFKRSLLAQFPDLPRLPDLLIDCSCDRAADAEISTNWNDRPLGIICTKRHDSQEENRESIKEKKFMPLGTNKTAGGMCPVRWDNVLF